MVTLCVRQNADDRDLQRLDRSVCLVNGKAVSRIDERGITDAKELADDIADVVCHLSLVSFWSLACIYENGVLF